jgi:hypothetical protein
VGVGRAQLMEGVQAVGLSLPHFQLQDGRVSRSERVAMLDDEVGTVFTWSAVRFDALEEFLEHLLDWALELGRAVGVGEVLPEGLQRGAVGGGQRVVLVVDDLFGLEELINGVGVSVGVEHSALAAHVRRSRADTLAARGLMSSRKSFTARICPWSPVCEQIE